jgi:hypothetical protein
MYYINCSEEVMANVLNTDKKIAVIGALAEGSSIRSIERITAVRAAITQEFRSNANAEA